MIAVAPPTTARPARVRFLPTRENHAVTTLELFFDLVFVFAITQVTAFMADDVGPRGLLRGLVLFALLWWCWCSYAWLGNQARADAGVVRAAMLIAMAALFLAALAIPEAWNDMGGGLSAPVVLAACIGLVRMVHLAVYWLAAGGDARPRRQLAPTAGPGGTASVLPAAGAGLGGGGPTPLLGLAPLNHYLGG